MPEQQQFSEEEIKNIKDIRGEYAGIQNAFGQINMNRIRLESDLSALDDAHENISNKYKKIASNIMYLF